MNIKQTVRKMSAFIAGATMLGATFMGAMAYDLSNYPQPFITNGAFTGKIVVGSTAMPQDILGAIDIAARLQADAKTPVTVSGGSISVAGGKSEEVNLGTDLTVKFGNNVDYNDVAALQSGSLDVSIAGVDNTYDWHDQVQLTAGARVDTGTTATNPDEKFQDGAYLLLSKDAIGYNFVFDDSLKAGNLMANATSDDPITLDFLGKSLEVISATASSMTIKAGEKLYLGYGEKAQVEGKTVTLVRVGSTSAIVNVNGEQNDLNTGQTKTIGGLRVKLEAPYYEQDPKNSAATLIAGTDAEKTYNDGDAYIGQDKNDPDWVWNFANLDTPDPTIGILYDKTVDAPSKNPVTVGGAFGLPGDYIDITLASFNENSWKLYTVDTSTGESLRSAAGVEIIPSAKVLHLKADGGNKNGFRLGGQKSDEVAFYFNETAGMTQVYWKDSSDANKYKYFEQFPAGNNASLFTLTYKDTIIPVGVVGNISKGGNLTFAGSHSADLQLFVQTSGSVGSLAFTYLGHSQGDTIKAADVFAGTTDISGWKYDTMLSDGIKVSSYDSSATSDELMFSVPQDDNKIAVNVAIAGGNGSISTTSAPTDTGAYKVNMLGVGVGVLDTDAEKLLGTEPLIVVGGPTVNTIAMQLMGNPTRDQIVKMFTPGKAKIKLYASQNALLVAGYNAQDTVGASYVLASYDQYHLTGSEVEVVVPSLSQISITTPTLPSSTADLSGSTTTTTTTTTTSNTTTP